MCQLVSESVKYISMHGEEQDTLDPAHLSLYTSCANCGKCSFPCWNRKIQVTLLGDEMNCAKGLISCFCEFPHLPWQHATKLVHLSAVEL